MEKEISDKNKVEQVNDYFCEDCKWNFICKNESNKKRCSQFEIDRILSEKYIDKIIEKRRKIFLTDWNNILCENTDYRV